MSPLRWDVLGVSFVLALPLFALWLRGEFSVEELTGRLPWCLLAGWAAVALLRWAAQSRTLSADVDGGWTTRTEDETTRL